MTVTAFAKDKRFEVALGILGPALYVLGDGIYNAIHATGFSIGQPQVFAALVAGLGVILRAAASHVQSPPGGTLPPPPPTEDIQATLQRLHTFLDQQKAISAALTELAALAQQSGSLSVVAGSVTVTPAVSVPNPAPAPQPS